MSRPPYDNALPQYADLRKYTYHGVTLEGQLALSGLRRLAAELLDSQGQARVRVQFAHDDQRRQILTGRVSAEVSLLCQRCLHSCRHQLDSEFAVAVVGDDLAAGNLPAELEPWIVADEMADLYELVEEELLLSLPAVARHSEPCIESSLLSSGEPPEEEDAPASDNPFQVLEQLKGRSK